VQLSQTQETPICSRVRLIG